MANELRPCPCDIGDKFDYGGRGQEVQIEHIRAYVSKPSASTDKAVIMIHDIFGWQLPNTRYMADMLTANGYIAICPDFFVGQEAWKPSNDWASFDDWLKTRQASKIDKEVDVVLKYLKEQCGVKDIGAIGFCWGGAAVQHLMLKNPHLKTGVSLYGVIRFFDERSSLLHPTFFIFAENDHIVPLEQVTELEQKLKQNCKVDYKVKIYPGQTHGFVHRKREDINPQDKPYIEEGRKDMIIKICGEDGQVDPNCFVTAQSIVFNAMEQEHFSEFLRSHHFCKYQIEVLTSGTVYLADILFCESALFYFSEYMEKEEAVNVLQFWLAADNFQSQLAAKKGQYDGQEAQNDAMILYDKYFSLQATHPLGFDDSVRLEIESNICREGGPLPNCFTTPLRQAWTTMETVFLPGFLSSNLYYKYLNDLIHSVRGDEFPGGNIALNIQGPGSSPDSDSIGGPDGSASQSNVKKANVKILKNFDEAIIVDAASLDPESLYQRTYAGKMTFGRVSDLGQFIRESEPEPDVKKSKGSMFSQAMKKWVQGNTDEAQEEMAWRIAKMIVNDVMQQAQCEQRSEKITKL